MVLQRFEIEYLLEIGIGFFVTAMGYEKYYYPFVSGIPNHIAHLISTEMYSHY